MYCLVSRPPKVLRTVRPDEAATSIKRIGLASAAANRYTQASASGKIVLLPARLLPMLRILATGRIVSYKQLASACFCPPQLIAWRESSTAPHASGERKH